jgi:type 1 glutamine amidotransferase
MTTSDDNAKKGLSRRTMFGAAAVAAAVLPAFSGARAQAGRGEGGPINSTSLGGGLPQQGGQGNIRVLFISSYHAFDRENLFRCWDRMGNDITWTHVEHPAAEHFFDPALAADYDVFLLYDAFAGSKLSAPDANGRRALVPQPPSAKLQANMKQLMTNGDKGFVFFHHALASWVHTWPAGVNGSNAYVEMMGAAADWGTPLKNLRGKDYPNSGYRQGTEQRITVMDKAHPITQGLPAQWDMIDETYLCPMFEDSVHCLTRTDFVPTADKFLMSPNSANVGAGHAPGSTMTSWVKTAENSPIVYIQHGHDNNAWSNPYWQKLMLNSIKWAASPESKTWAKANSKRIFV